MDLFRTHQAPELLGAVNTRGEDHRRCFLEDEIDRLHRTSSLLGEDNTKIDNVLPGTGDGLFSPVPDRNAGSKKNDDEKPKTDKRKMPAGAKTLIERAIEFHHS